MSGYPPGYPGAYPGAGYPPPGAYPPGAYGAAPGMAVGVAPVVGVAAPGVAVGVAAPGGIAVAPVGAVVTVFQAPTTFQVRKNFFAYGGQMEIMQNGVPYFRCVSYPSPIGYGHAFNLTDLAGNSLCYIQPDLSFGMPHFHIYLRGFLYATLKQDWTMYEKKFELHNKQTGEHVKVYGDWFAFNFQFQRHHGGQVAQIVGYSDCYDITVYPGEDALFILAAALTIEKLCHEHRHHHRHGW